MKSRLSGSGPERQPGLLGLRRGDVVFGIFRIRKELGSGGEGKVYLAWDPRLKREVALKVVRTCRTRGSEGGELTRAQLEGAPVAHIYDVKVAGEHSVIIGQYIPGQSLADMIAEAAGRPSTWFSADSVRRVVKIIIQIARALEASHRQGVINRDVKPGNIIVTPEDNAVLTDFGLARSWREPATAEDLLGDGDGTPPYLAPEQVASQQGFRPGPRTDIYALGVTLYEALALRNPFDRGDPNVTRRAVLTLDVPGLRTINPEVSADLEAVARKAMNRDPDQRYQRARKFARDLELVYGGFPVAARHHSLAERAGMALKRRPWISARAALLLVAIVGFGFLWSRNSSLAELAEAEAQRQRKDAAGEARDAALEELQFGQVAKAVEAYRKADELDPGDGIACIDRVFCLLDAGMKTEAFSCLPHPPYPADCDPATRRLRAYLLSRTDQRDRAREEAAKLAVPGAWPEWYVLGMCALRESDHPVPEIRHWSAQAWNDREDPPLGGHRRDGLLALAIDAFQQADALDGNRDTRSRIGLARALSERVQPADWEADLARRTAESLERGRKITLCTTYAAALAWMAADPGRAVRGFRRVILQRPRHGATRHNLGLALHRLGWLDAALHHLRVAEECSPPDARTRVAIGNVLLEFPRHEEAAKAYRTALELDLEDYGAHFNLARVLAEGGHGDEAERHYVEAIRLKPSDTQARVNLANLQAEARRFDEALATLAVAEPTTDHEIWSIHFHCGLIHLEAGSLDQAGDELEAAARSRPHHAPTWLQRGMIETRLGHHEDAVQSLRAAVTLDPDIRPLEGDQSAEQILRQAEDRAARSETR